MTRNLNRRPSVEGEPFEAQVMDVGLDIERGEDVPLASRCYMSNTSETKLVPERLAGYTCRWIHFTSPNPSFDQFTLIVDDLMREYGDKERKVVQDGLRRFRVQNEVRGSRGPTFRPAYAKLNPDASQNDCVDGRHSHEIPAFYSVPTIHFEAMFHISRPRRPFVLAIPSSSPSSSSSISSYSSTHSSESFASLPPPPTVRLPTGAWVRRPNSIPSTPSPPAPPPVLRPSLSALSLSTPPIPLRPLPPPPAPFSAKKDFSSAARAAMGTSGARKVVMETHNKRSLFQYHYIFGKEEEGRNELSISNHLSEMSMEPTVYETWCLVVDEKNLVTVSRLTGGEIWPMGIYAPSRLRDKLPNSLLMAIWHYLKFQSRLGYLDGSMEFMTQFPLFSSLLVFGWVLYAVITDLISVFVPLVWITAYIPRIFPLLILGPELNLSGCLRILSVIFTMSRLAQYHPKLLQRPQGKDRHEWIFKLLMPLLQFFACSVGTPNLELASPSLGRHMNHWVEVEAKLRSQEDPPEEVFKALRRLWIIVLHFSMNFFTAPDGTLYRLDVYCVERRLIRIVWKGIKLVANRIGLGSGKVSEVQPNKMRISELPSKKGETLQDLETEFLVALDNLEWQLTVANEDIETVDRFEDQQLLRSIHQSGGYPALACIMRMCTITGPTRFMIASRDISDLYATRISEQEFLMRDSVTRSLVYLISDTEDELRILKGILNSQQEVIKQVAISYAKVLIEDRDDDHLDRDSPINVQEHFDSDTLQGLVESLQRRAKTRHEILMSEIQRHEEAIARLKEQSAILIGIKAERQELAIFVFTLVTIIFLPLSFVTSYLGMNTIDIRDTEAGQGLFWTIAGPLTVFVLFISWLIGWRGLTFKTYRQRKRLRHVEGWKWRYWD